jgi:hypothetical protein
VHVGQPRGFWPVDSFLFYSEFISDSNLENSYLDIQSCKYY